MAEATLNPTSVVGASYEYRDALNDTVVKAVSSNPNRLLLGYGLGTFRQYGLEIPFQGTVKRWYTCDNNWALFLYETGTVGCALIGIILLCPCVRMVRDYTHFPRPEKYLSAVIFIVLTSFYFMLMSVAGYSWGQQGHMLWIIISLSVVYSEIVRRDLKKGLRLPKKIKSPAPRTRTEAALPPQPPHHEHTEEGRPTYA
jgi:hypothetical protein